MSVNEQHRAWQDFKAWLDYRDQRDRTQATVIRLPVQQSQAQATAQK